MSQEKDSRWAFLNERLEQVRKRLDPLEKTELTPRLQGTIDQGFLTYVIQFIKHVPLSGSLVIVGDETNVIIQFRKGKIIEAKNSELSGSEAIYHALKISTGRFYFYEIDHLEIEGETVHDTMELLFETIVRMDEEARTEDIRIKD